jgi:serine/threonine protein kinase
MHREAALKLITSHRTVSAKAHALFQREVELTARLDHSNIASVYESGLHRAMHYSAMELIDGVPLDQYVRANDLVLLFVSSRMSPSLGRNDVFATWRRTPGDPWSPFVNLGPTSPRRRAAELGMRRISPSLR